MSHEVTIVNIKTEKMEKFIISNIEDYIKYIKQLFESELFYVELNPKVELLSLEEFKDIIRSNPEAEGIIFPDNIETAEELDYWVQSWKVLEDIYELSLLN